MTNAYEDAKAQLLDAALMHVPFDGWSEATFKAAIRDTAIDEPFARTVCPRGAVDLAIAYHKAGDAAMVTALAQADLSGMKFREKVAHAVKLRLQAIDDREAVRRGTTLFALPHLVADGSKLIWGTADAIWTALGDTSEDYNWYTKRLTLSGVYSATVLYWLGDDSADNQATWEFLDRRIGDVMQFEKVKAQVHDNPLLKPFMAGPNWLLSQIKPPKRGAEMDMPGMMNPES
ncbi:MAG: COQ9 family protein [Rhodobacteraceae bacterium]|nr:COQ9 family protein [Paracoccaceae bacterium]